MFPHRVCSSSAFCLKRQLPLDGCNLSMTIINSTLKSAISRQNAPKLPGGRTCLRQGNQHHSMAEPGLPTTGLEIDYLFRACMYRYAYFEDIHP